MAGARRTSPTKAQMTTATKPRARSGRGVTADAIFWEIIAISSHIEEISFGWARMLGVNVHQWMVLMAIQDLDQGAGVSVGGVSAKLYTDPSIVTTQSKALEKGGWIRRSPSPEDARVVLMTATAKATDEIARIKGRRDEIKRSIFEELDDQSLVALHSTLSDLSDRFLRAERRLLAEL